MVHQTVIQCEDKGPGVLFGLIVRAEDSDSRSDSEENDSRLLSFRWHESGPGRGLCDHMELSKLVERKTGIQDNPGHYRV